MSHLSDQISTELVGLLGYAESKTPPKTWLAASAASLDCVILELVSEVVIKSSACTDSTGMLRKQPTSPHLFSEPKFDFSQGLRQCRKCRPFYDCCHSVLPELGVAPGAWESSDLFS